MKAVKLTKNEKELFDLLLQNPGGVLRQHVKPTKTVCFRVLDAKRNPLKNIRYGLVYQLKDKNILDTLPDGDFVLKATGE